MVEHGVGAEEDAAVDVPGDCGAFCEDHVGKSDTPFALEFIQREPSVVVHDHRGCGAEMDEPTAGHDVVAVAASQTHAIEGDVRVADELVLLGVGRDGAGLKRESHHPRSGGFFLDKTLREGGGHGEFLVVEDVVGGEVERLEFRVALVDADVASAQLEVAAQRLRRLVAEVNAVAVVVEVGVDLEVLVLAGPFGGIQGEACRDAVVGDGELQRGFEIGAEVGFGVHVALGAAGNDVVTGEVGT